MHEGGFFYQALIYLAAAVVSVPVAKRLGLGSVLGYLIAGIIIGPFALGLIGEEGQDVMHFAEFGVVMMLFLIGLELQPTLLWKMRGPILGLGGLQVLGTSVLVAGVSLLAGLPWQSAIAVGLTLALSSTAIVLQTLNEKGLMKTEGGQNAFSVLLFQDIAVIPMLALFPLLAVPALKSAQASVSESHHTLISSLPAWGQTLVVLASLALIVAAGKYLMHHIFRFIAQTRLREIFTATALLIVVGIAVLMTQIGLSPALGTFVAGVVLAGNEYRHELEGDIEPFKGLLLGLFFISVGASIDFRLIANEPLLIAGLVVALILIKMLVLFVLAKAFKMNSDHKRLFTFALAQGGEFAFVLFSFSVQNAVLSQDIANPLIAAVAVSMALTPLLMILNEKVFSAKAAETDERESDTISEQNAVIIAGFGKFGSIIGRFLRANGVPSTVLETDPQKIEILRKLGLKVYYGDASRTDLLRAAGAETASLMIITIDDAEKISEIVESVQKHFPKLPLLVKAKNRPNAYDVIEKGARHVYYEPLDSSLSIGVQALQLLGVRAFQATRAARLFRKHEQQSVFDLAKMKHDRKGYLQSARQMIRDLEELMLSELNFDVTHKDSGWDPHSLKEELKKFQKIS